MIVDVTLTDRIEPAAARRLYQLLFGHSPPKPPPSEDDLRGEGSS